MQLEVGSKPVWVRASDPELVAEIRRRFGSAPTTGAPVPRRADLSVYRSEPELAGARPLHFVYADQQLLLRSASEARLWRALAGLAADLAGTTPPGSVRIAGLVAVASQDGAAAVFPALFAGLPGLETRLRRAGWELRDATGADVDADGVVRGRDVGISGGGRWPLRRWVLFDPAEEAATPLQRMALAQWSIDRGASGDGDVLKVLVDGAQEDRFHTVATLTVHELVRALERP